MRDWIARIGAALAATVLLLAPTNAHIVAEEPWHPLAASYRTMMFMADLEPVPWKKIHDAYHAPTAGSLIGRPAVDYVSGLAGGLSQAIDEAIVSQNRQALYEASTRAVSRMARDMLAKAEASLAEPGTARRHLDDARALYRAFDVFVTETDANGARDVGLAWLELSGAIGTSGVSGRGAEASRSEVFAAARGVIDAYLVTNFEPASFTPRQGMTPLPETVVAERGEVSVKPWLPPGSNIGDQVPLPRLILDFEENGIDEADLPLVAYGDMLFDSPQIFGEPARSLNMTCSRCHNRSDINQAFTIPGLSSRPGAVDVDSHFFNAMFNDRADDAIDIPSLRGIRLLGPYGRDGRIGSLREFTRNVIVTEFGGDEPTEFMLDALVAYQRAFGFLPNSKLDVRGRLTDQASEAAQRGEALFRKPFPQMDGQACSSCHIPSANFVDRRPHNIGSGPDGYAGARNGSFDTPTLLGTRFTAPYFHDGSLPTLASVVDWFDSEFELDLSEQERADLTAYVEAVGDADEPYQSFDDRETVFRLAWEELTTFASTLDTLLPARDAFHARLLVDTVAPDLELDASGMGNLAAKPDVYRIAGLLRQVGDAIDAGDWDKAGEHWDAFKSLQNELDPEMY